MMFKTYSILIALSIVLIAVPAYCGKRCSKVSDCACGRQCVRIPSNGNVDRICNGGYKCECLKGCGVGDHFIPSGSHKTAHCNGCSCPKGQHDGTPRCTRKAWCGLKPGNPYYDNPNCKKGY